MKRGGLLIRDGEAVDRQRLGGFLNIDKPAGFTSHDVVAKIRSLSGIKRVGHLGTLDPEATGVLPICFGKGTKLASLLNGADKAYDAVLRLGEETDTEDATGKVTQTTLLPEYLKSSDGDATILQTLASFVGAYSQKPPMYSAVKIKGVPLYRIARSGEVVERSVRQVMIRNISFLGHHGADISFRVDCSKGTYIRTLCADIGRKLGVGAHLLSLRRIRAGNFRIEDAIDLESFSLQCKGDHWLKTAYSINSVLEGIPVLWVKTSQAERVLQGVQIGLDALEKWDVFKRGEPLRFLDPSGNLIAVGCALQNSDRATGALEPLFRIKTVLGL